MSQPNAATQMTTPGDFATPGSKYYALSRPSDYMLSHLTRFAAEDTARSDKWQMVLDASVKVPTSHTRKWCACHEALVCGEITRALVECAG